jgi:hypothetical protein
MRLEDCYRLLELDPGASDAEVKLAHRDLTKVWHPDRFGHDASLRQKAEERLKAVNEAYETIRASRESGWSGTPRPTPGEGGDGGAWRVRSHGREMRVAGLHAVVTLVNRGAVGEEAEVFDPATGRWIPLADIPELRTALTRRQVRLNRIWAFTCAVIAILILLRRPTPAGLVIALVLFGVAFLFVARMRMRD